MNKLKKYRPKRTHDDFPPTGRHLHFLRIHAFANEGIDFTEKETAHFDICRACRLKVVDALRNVQSQAVRTTTPKAA
jgi:hypothetical protein